MSGIVGRERQLALVDGLVRSDEPRLEALVIEGEPGIGKSTLWQAGIDSAAAGGLVLLRSRTVQAEAQLTFASLADLLDPIVDSVLGELPEPQRIAIDDVQRLDRASEACFCTPRSCRRTRRRTSCSGARSSALVADADRRAGVPFGGSSKRSSSK